ncbi:MAG: S4 domain-containing protein [Bacilli bacterium]|jgi:ribosomal 50S subunit-recycling heat shock protein
MMRIDLFLKKARIVKRRTISKEIILAGHVKINSKTAVPSTKVKKDDCIEIKLGQSCYRIKVLCVDEKELQKNPEACFTKEKIEL